MSKPKDLKEALGNRSKPDITHVSYDFDVYCARASEYGDDKYVRDNYRRPVKDTREAFLRYRAYIRSVISHLKKNLRDMSKHQALDPNLEDAQGMLDACFSPDTEEGTKDGKVFPASGLPHAAHAAAGLMMTITQAVDFGLLPEDPGTPWVDSGTKNPVLFPNLEGPVENVVYGPATQEALDREEMYKQTLSDAPKWEDGPLPDDDEEEK